MPAGGASGAVTGVPSATVNVAVRLPGTPSSRAFSSCVPRASATCQLKGAAVALPR